MTQITYTDILSLDSNSNPSIVSQVHVYFDNQLTATLTFSGATLATGGTAQVQYVGSATYTGYEAPDGSPIVVDSNQNYFMLTNGSYNQGDAINPMQVASVACFAAGTRIMTARGEVAVECLTPGDLVPTLVGRHVAAIRWIGHTQVDCARHPRPWDVNPVRVAAGAFGPGLPLRDLSLSPDHSVFVDGVLVPIRYLVNGATVRQETVSEMTYWHVELESHDIIFAEGLPAESYLDTGNRAAFSNAGPQVLHPDFRLVDRDVWAKEACGELVESGPVIEAIRARLAVRAAQIGQPIAPAHNVDLAAVGRTEVSVPAGTSRIVLVSPCLVPSGESRRLGVCIGQITVDQVVLSLDSPELAAGFHAVETVGARSSRWTNGEAVLELPVSDQPRLLAIDVRLCAAAPLACAA